MEIKLELDTLERSKRGLITGVIYLDLISSQFPDDRWNDHPVVLLSWWLDRLNAILSSVTSRVELRFMDGPFGLEIKRLHAGNYHLQTLERDIPTHVTNVEKVKISALLDGALKHSRDIASVCAQHNWNDSDIETLSKTVQHVQRTKLSGGMK